MDKFAQLRHQFVRRGNKGPFVFYIIFTIEAHHHATRFAHYQCTCSNVPWLESNFEKAIQPACSNPSKVKAGSACAAEVFNFFEHSLEDPAI